MDLSKRGFAAKIFKSESISAYTNQLRLKIYIYGYFNGIRSDRRLETECCRNIELQWLTANLMPDYHSIADFRKINPLALKAVFTLYVFSSHPQTQLSLLVFFILFSSIHLYS